jgi:membrane associated rhomboid family serine protease
LTRFVNGRPPDPWTPDPPPVRPAREPAFQAPAPVLAVAGAIILGYAVQTQLPQLVDALALVPADLARGRVWPLLTVILVHGSWMHAGLNALGALAFGTPVARWFGAPRGRARFLLFYLLCALLSSLGYALLNWGRQAPLVGASGAVYGLIGASARLLDRSGRLAPFASRTVVAMTLAFVVLNILLALNWIDAGQGAMPVAWQAHLVGYGAGLLLIGPFTPKMTKR